ncbi:hypothetical protein AOLI_G00245200 [Acnodon oligacanthus]
MELLDGLSRRSAPRRSQRGCGTRAGPARTGQRGTPARDASAGRVYPGTPSYQLNKPQRRRRRAEPATRQTHFPPPPRFHCGSKTVLSLSRFCPGSRKAGHSAATRNGPSAPAPEPAAPGSASVSRAVAFGLAEMKRAALNQDLTVHHRERNGLQREQQRCRGSGDGFREI